MRQAYRLRVLSNVALIVLLATAVGVPACSSKKQQDEVRRTLGPPRPSAYIGMLAAVHYCACGRWPRSWSELRAFDGFLHELGAGNGGGKNRKRFAWEQFSESTVMEDADGRFLATLRSADPPTNDQMMVPIPDCSAQFQSGLYQAGCQR